MQILSKSPSRNRKIAAVGPDNKTPEWPYIYASYRAVGPTCPLRCGFHPDKDGRVHGQKCYARKGRVAIHQKRAQPDEGDGAQVYRWLQGLPDGAGVRINVSGDIAADGSKLDKPYLDGLTKGFKDRPELNGWLYTHVEKEQWLEVQNLAPSNLAINWSCDSLAEAQEAQEEGLTGLTCVISKEQANKRMRGVTVCPEQTSGIACAKCKICWKGDRKTIVAFIAH